MPSPWRSSVIATRIVCVIPFTYLPRLLFPSMRRRDPYPPWQSPFVCWTGMRGAVTLAAALAIPLAPTRARRSPRVT